ncbi:hypothetical protein AVEN_183024-1, partial [Araneus ventricosus]
LLVPELTSHHYPYIYQKFTKSIPVSIESLVRTTGVLRSFEIDSHKFWILGAYEKELNKT